MLLVHFLYIEKVRIFIYKEPTTRNNRCILVVFGFFFFNTPFLSKYVDIMLCKEQKQQHNNRVKAPIYVYHKKKEEWNMFKIFIIMCLRFDHLLCILFVHCRSHVPVICLNFVAVMLSVHLINIHLWMMWIGF